MVNNDRCEISPEGQNMLKAIAEFTLWDQMDGTYMAIGAKAYITNMKINELESRMNACNTLSEGDIKLLKILICTKARMEEMADEVYNTTCRFNWIINSLEIIRNNGYIEKSDMDKIWDSIRND